MTDEERERLIRAIFEPDDDCAHSVVAIAAEVERILAEREAAARRSALLEFADWWEHAQRAESRRLSELRHWVDVCSALRAPGSEQRTRPGKESIQ